MKNEFIPYEQALALKELGFDEDCFGRYWIKEFQLRSPRNYNAPAEKIDSVSAPLYQQAFRWFRKKHKLEAYSIPTKTLEKGWFQWNIYGHDWHEPAKTYEEAELACLRKLIEIVKGKL